MNCKNFYLKTLLPIVAMMIMLQTGKAFTPKFGATTVPLKTDVSTQVKALRSGSEWKISVTARNNGKEKAIFKLRLTAEPHIKNATFLIPGINYNGNMDVPNLPTSWQKDGEPWVFSYDRGSIPSCTISENDERVFALYASTDDTLSYVSSCAVEKLQDSSFRHVMYWPVTEAPLTYSGKLKFTDRYDTYLTLFPGEEITVKANACTGKPQWRGYGFAEVFPYAWKNLSHEVPAQHSVAETRALDKAFQDWSRRQDDEGYWYGGIVDDEVFIAGYYGTGKSHDGYTVEDYYKNPSLNRWATDEINQSKHLRKGEYVRGPGRSIGFGAQSFQMARLSIRYGLENNSPEDLDFGIKVLKSWISVRGQPSGFFCEYKKKDKPAINASHVGWAISEFSRVAMLLGEQGTEFKDAATRLVKPVLAGVRQDGNIGSVWNWNTGKVMSYNGDGGGYVLMGLVKYWEMTHDDSLIPVIDKAFEYYYRTDINSFRCFGGAMDCASIDREGIHPFMTAAITLYKKTGKEKYLEYARKAGWYFLSWLYIQNPIYDPSCDFAVFNWKPAGATIVGTEHSALDEYACVLLPEFFALSKIDRKPIWKEVAALIWRNGTQGFADANRPVWHNLERPLGSKNEAIFPSRWSKYKPVESARGSINDHLTAWAGTYRLASLYELSEEDILWLDQQR